MTSVETPPVLVERDTDDAREACAEVAADVDVLTVRRAPVALPRLRLLAAAVAFFFQVGSRPPSVVFALLVVSIL